MTAGLAETLRPKDTKSTQVALGVHLGISDKTVRELHKKGVLLEEWDCDFDKCRLAYIEHLRKVAAGRVKERSIDPEWPDKDTEQARYYIAQRRFLEDKHKAFLRTLVKRTDTINAFGAIVARVRSALLRIPKREAATIFGKKSVAEVREHLYDAVVKVLEELSETPVVEGDQDDDEVLAPVDDLAA